ncbi:hypothetical protein K504DRAFT_244036 [Pleomassaria siparia CBS 279.74]|uniref:Serine-rich protein n=1 Tax=Pleomassaria siparia CBS 279.74 TaxID=1314801 RepID=A0A6G1KE80_9PLEO|nr:hypothetical protein K504DRAFT_244036 [Pleomassaria siparia CBS 279.74]
MASSPPASPRLRNHRASTSTSTSASASASTSTTSPHTSRVVSPLQNFPKFSPPSRRRNTSPGRRPLHDRSNSQTNQHPGPTIRIVEDPGLDATHVYSKTPFPSHGSQILPPRKKPGYVFEGRGRGVSDLSPVANAVAKIEAGQSLVPKPLPHRKAVRHSTSTSTSDADTIVASSSFSPSSTRFSQGSTPPSSPTPNSWIEEKGLEILDEDIPLPPPLQNYSTIRTVPPSSSSAEDADETRALTPRASAASLDSSLASSASTDTLGHPDEHRISRPISKVPNYALSESSQTSQKQASSIDQEAQRPTTDTSAGSLSTSEYTYTASDRPASSPQPSATIHEAQHSTLTSGVRINFPIVRAPSASSLWAQSQNLPTISSRMNNRASQVHHWSSQLSTIPSESDRASRSIERRSQSFDGATYSHDDHSGNRTYPVRRRQTIESIASSDNASSNPGTGSSIAVPLPLFSPVTRPSHEGRDSDEVYDTISPLQPPPIKKQRSGFLRRRDSDSRSSSSRPSSSQSDFSTLVANTLPAWARVYYRRGERASIGAPESTSDASEVRLSTAQSGRTNTPSEGNFPLSIYRPRNRPHERMSYPETISTSGNHPAEQEIYVIGSPRRPRGDLLFVPHLRLDRRSQARLSAWKAPSFDDTLGTMLFSRQNRQIVLFVFGFIFPFSWMIAAFLPLPPNPDMTEISPSQLDVERQFDQEIGPVDDRSYQKALWWRNLNRIMAAIGTLLIGVIVSRPSSNTASSCIHADYCLSDCTSHSRITNVNPPRILLPQWPHHTIITYLITTTPQTHSLKRRDLTLMNRPFNDNLHAIYVL